MQDIENCEHTCLGEDLSDRLSVNSDRIRVIELTHKTADFLRNGVNGYHRLICCKVRIVCFAQHLFFEKIDKDTSQLKL